MSLRDPPGERSITELIEFGVINLDKPPGPTSHQVSNWVSDLLTGSKTAHVGTLDPKVTGCLPILTGTATRLVQALLDRKQYVTVLELHADPPSDWHSIISEFEAVIYQKPPKKSAVQRSIRSREIYELEVLERHERQVLLSIECESGTYIRKLCHDIGLALGTGAHMGDLRRTSTTPFTDSDLVSLYDLTDALEAWRDRATDEPLRSMLHPGERALTHLPTVIIAESAAREVTNGAPIYAPGIIHIPDIDQNTLVACYTPGDAVVCLGRLVGDPDATNGKIIDLERVLTPP